MTSKFARQFIAYLGSLGLQSGKQSAGNAWDILKTKDVGLLQPAYESEIIAVVLKVRA
ncbi:hypothetical protein NBRC116598_16240 [Pseudophaeobacter arcticus]|uniref:Uncharacterized protein n=1 Tax=Pseudophaeobacter arcticus TaxID=385492 RepID=A0ABQ0AK07_9RHOB